MTNFANLKNGRVSIQTFRDVQATVAGFNDIKNAIKNNTGERLTAWVTDEQVKSLISEENSF